MSFIVATQNARWFNEATDATFPDRAWDVRCPLIADRIRQSGASIIGMQESRYPLDGVSQARMVAQRLGKHWRVTDGGANTALIWDNRLWKLTGTSQSVQLTVTILRQMKYPNRSEPAGIWGVFVERATGKRVAVMSLHGPTADDVPTGYTFIEMATEVGRRIGDVMADIYEQRGIPIVALGDYNSTGTTQSNAVWKAGQRGLTVEDVTGRTGLRHSPISSLNSWNAATPPSGTYIDRILVSDGLTTGEVGVVLKFASGAHVPLATPLPSDHNLVSAVLSWE